mmetsp:Transcript_39126/g.72929  ORF Transcript_39126/g.72929 Transcript_39126/m.72929 type:complete len:213 (-) Transcript_39126:124-762(-)
MYKIVVIRRQGALLRIAEHSDKAAFELMVGRANANVTIADEVTVKTLGVADLRTFQRPGDIEVRAQVVEVHTKIRISTRTNARQVDQGIHEGSPTFREMHPLHGPSCLKFCCCLLGQGLDRRLPRIVPLGCARRAVSGILSSCQGLKKLIPCLLAGIEDVATDACSMQAVFTCGQLMFQHALRAKFCRRKDTCLLAAGIAAKMVRACCWKND